MPPSSKDTFKPVSKVPLREKIKRVKELLTDYGKVVCAVSGGVDSTLLWYLALKTLGKDRVLGATFVSNTYPLSELKEVLKLKGQSQTKHLFLLTNELRDRRFIKNPPERCYFCKKDAYSFLRRVIERTDFSDAVIIEGTNLSDLADFRPGRKALLELKIKSPFLEVGIKKDEIRLLAKRFNLPNFAKPSNPCLASRIPFFQKITEKELSKVEKGEAVLRRIGLNFFRLRSEGKIARIETLTEWDEVLKKRDDIVKGLKRLGYRYVTLDLEGYRPMGKQWKRR
uniref:ATP-dependent sacrificial sulfur transferase LarE n=1 Tax=candidate division WOR-3 bacterium TaxID=2052148 RepID=A0A7C3Z0N5_UNCW3